jgi:transposase
MEATSDYWRPVYYPLQDASLHLMLVNPAHLKGIRGRKSDPGDAAFLARAIPGETAIVSQAALASCGTPRVGLVTAKSWAV